jgi:two-component system, NtrC family, response regulator AtoC
MKALVVDDEAPIREIVAETLRSAGWEVTEADSAPRALEFLHSDKWSLVFCDVRLGGEGSPDGYVILRRFGEEQPEALIVLMTGHGSAAGALDAISFGAYDYLMKPFDAKEVAAISVSARRVIEKRTRRKTTPELPQAYTSNTNLVGCSTALVELMKVVGRVAATNLPVLISGESGTGKEVVARAIHLRSARATGPFVPINCGAIPAELIESELFGHVRGSFTGAMVDRQGLWQDAEGGTIFLDEISETTRHFQVKLLRALQEGEIRRVGSNQTKRVEVRVIAATNRDITSEVREGRFRQDLYYRLNGVTLHLPPLRDRRADIMPLAKHFASSIAVSGEAPVTFSREATTLLGQYSWPGNIRELENAVFRAAALCDQTVHAGDLPEGIRNTAKLKLETTIDDITRLGRPEEELMTLAQIEARHVVSVLAHTRGNQQAAARILGIDRTTLKRMIKRHGLSAAPRGSQTEKVAS